MTARSKDALLASDPHASFQIIAGRLSRALGRADESTLDVTATACLEEISGFADADVTFITLVDDERRSSADWRWCRAGLDATAPPIGSLLSTTFGSATELLRVGTTVVVDDLSDRASAAPGHPPVGTGELRAMVIAPVIVGLHFLGVMGLQVYHRPRRWERTLVAQVEFLAQALVQAISRTRHQGALAVADARARRIAAYIPDGLLLLTTEGTVSWVSPSFCEMSGLIAPQIVNRAATSFFHPSHRQVLEDDMARATAGQDVEVTTQFRSDAGDWRWADVVLRLASEPESGAPDEIVMSVRDVQERQLREQSLARQADLDPLTGLANRAAFERAVAALAERDVRVLVAFCDIDDFKTINDRFGHAVGDQVLRTVASAIEDVMRGCDIVARFGGDEFAVVATIEDDDAIFPLGARLLAVTRELAVYGTQISLSVGICGPGPAAEITAMRQKADQAMYRVKRSNKNDWIHVEWSPSPG